MPILYPIISRSVIAMAVAFAMCGPTTAQAAESADPPMASANMMPRCKELMEQRQQLMAEVKAQDAALADKVAAMNSTPEVMRLNALSAVVTLMSDQRRAIDALRAKLGDDMMQHMMAHMQMGKGSMPCATMQDMAQGPAKVPDGRQDHGGKGAQ